MSPLLRGLAGVGLGWLLWTASPPLQASPAPGWTQRLGEALAAVDAARPGRLGVYVRDLQTGEFASLRADETWYLASMVKVPIALAVLRGIERGERDLNTRLTLSASDYVDGAGGTNRHPAGARLSIQYLLEQTIVHSDNTSSDLLIGAAGLGNVEALVRSLVPRGFERMTTLGDVRRQVYAHLDPAASRLAGPDLLLLRRQQTDDDRLETLSRLLGRPRAEFRVPSLGDAYDAYYATGVNSARLDAYGDLLALMATGRALAPAGTAYLLDTMERVQTGPRRIKAGLPPFARFAHKTGTQRERVCDAGIVVVPDGSSRDRRVVVVACTRGESLEASERLLRQVGAALCRSGLLTAGRVHDRSCPAVPLPAPRSAQPDDPAAVAGPGARLR